MLAAERAARLAAEAERDTLRSAFTHAPAAVAMVMGPEHRYVLSNALNQELAGGRQLVGKRVLEALPEFEVQGLITLLDGVFHRGEPFVARELPVELPATAERPARTAYLSGVYQPVRDARGTVVGILAFAYEVTDLVTARQDAEQAEERFRLALDAARLGTWDYDPSRQQLACDERFRALCGLTSDEVATTPRLIEAVHPDDRRGVQQAVERSLSPGTGGIFTIECRTRTEKGVRWLSLKGRTFFDGSGRPVRFTGVAMDATEQVLAHESLRQAEERSRLLADALPEIVWTANQAGTVEFYNQRWYGYTGLPAGSVDPRGWASAVHPDDLPAITDRWAADLSAGRAFEAELRLRRADGAFRWHMAKSVPIRGPGGQVVRWVGSSVDIDDRKRVEEITRYLADATGALGASLDLDRTLRSLAQLTVPRLADWCTIRIADPEAPDGHRLYVSHVDPSKVQWAEELVRRFPSETEASSGDFQVTRNGTSEALRELGMSSAMTVPIQGHGGALGAITFVAAESGRRYEANDVVIAQSLAERAARAIENARLYKEAREAIRIRDEFIAVASHELRTPMTPIQLHLEVLSQMAGSLPEKVNKKVEAMGRQLQRLSRLVGNLLDISRIAERRLDVECEDVDLGDLVREVASRFEADAVGAGSTLSVHAEAAVVGYWDRLRLNQVVTNLLSNAVKFGTGRPIEISAGSSGAVAILVVRDNGIGISPGDQARIFGQFERAVPSRHFGGLGLGLWISREIVENLGGTITVESRPGEGSRFIVELPMQRPPSAADAPKH